MRDVKVDAAIAIEVGKRVTRRWQQRQVRLLSHVRKRAVTIVAKEPLIDQVVVGISVEVAPEALNPEWRFDDRFSPTIP